MYREQYGEYANWYKGVKDEFCTQFHCWFCVLLALSVNHMSRTTSQREPAIVFLCVTGQEDQWLARDGELDSQSNFFFFPH